MIVPAVTGTNFLCNVCSGTPIFTVRHTFHDKEGVLATGTTRYTGISTGDGASMLPCLSTASIKVDQSQMNCLYRTTKRPCACIQSIKIDMWLCFCTYIDSNIGLTIV